MSSCSRLLFQYLQEDLSSQVVGLEPIPFGSKPPPDWVGMSVSQVAASALRRSLLKKFKDATHKDANVRAKEKFVTINNRCARYSVKMNTSWDELVVGEVKASLYRFFYPSADSPLIRNFQQILSAGRCGPGAAVGSRGNDFYTKLFSSEMACTSSSLYEMYSRYIEGSSIWSEAERFRYDHYDGPKVVEGNRVSFVPKNDQISRMICIEPSLNMFFQLGLAHILEGRLRQVYGLDLSEQPFHNRELARRGSLDGSFATIDLESASDSMSRTLIKELFPPNVVGWLEFLRSRTASFPDGEVLQMEMISTMGNGFTFPLQTLLFACVVDAVYRLSNIKLVRPTRLKNLCSECYGNQSGNFAVFGDDIIIETGVSLRVIKALELFGFTVNADKTFVEGSFRESCGQDWFSGVDVRGVYLKELRTQQDHYIAINLLNDWSARTGISLSSCVQYLLGRCRFLPVPPWENVDAGIRVPLDLAGDLPRCKFTGALVYYKSKPQSRGLRLLDGEVRAPRRAKTRIYNPSGLYISGLGGYVRSNRILTRDGEVRYSCKRSLAPNWESTSTVRPFAGRVSWQRWETSVWLNFYRKVE